MRKRPRGTVRWIRLVVGGGRVHGFPKLRAEDLAFNIDPEARPDVQGDVIRIPFASETFGEVYFEKMRYDTFTGRNIGALDEAARVLQQGGRLVIDTGILAPVPETRAALRRLGFR